MQNANIALVGNNCAVVASRGLVNTQVMQYIGYLCQI